MRFSRSEIIDIVIYYRLSLYNQAKPSGARALRHAMQSAGITPLPSIATIHRILGQQSLTHRRTGHYPENHEKYL
jgi:hypothetical protein